jgi:hypothetical protein
MQVYDPKKDTGAHDVALGVVEAGGGRQVMMTFEHPITNVVWDAENARMFAEQLAKAAYEAHTGIQPREMGSMLGDEKRLQMIHRIALVADSLAKDGKTNIQIAEAVLEVILKEVA